MGCLRDVALLKEDRTGGGLWGVGTSPYSQFAVSVCGGRFALSASCPHFPVMVDSNLLEPGAPINSFFHKLPLVRTFVTMHSRILESPQRVSVQTSVWMFVSKAVVV